MDHQPEGGATTEEDLHTICLEQTATALYDSGAATEKEIQQAARECYKALDQAQNCELIEFVAHAQGHHEADLQKAILKLSRRAASTLENPPSFIPFASKLIVPNTFYGTYPEMRQICKDLLCPMIYAEDTDAIGIASINPVAATLIAKKIGEIAFSRTGIRPFVTTALLDYQSWCALTRKHFER